jgi:dTDP-4-dehydrorhamnose reductase
MHRKKILITGAKGMLGNSFRNLIKSKYPDYLIDDRSKAELNVTDLTQVLSLAPNKYDYIIHCAALVNADFCEQNEMQSFNSIVVGTRNITALATRIKAKILFPQSFLIFDGTVNPVTENTDPSPLCVYGRHKYIAEQEILSTYEDALVVRMGGFFGGYEKDKNFVGKFTTHLIDLLNTGITKYAVGDRIWQPTFTDDIATNCLFLMESDSKGIYNMASHGKASFYDVALQCIKSIQLPNFDIEMANSTEINNFDRAIRPKRLILSNERLTNEKLDLQRSWEESLGEYLKHPFFMNKFRRFTNAS